MGVCQSQIPPPAHSSARCLEPSKVNFFLSANKHGDLLSFAREFNISSSTVSKLFKQFSKLCDQYNNYDKASIPRKKNNSSSSRTTHHNSNSHKISILDFLMSLDIERTEFNVQAFTVLDKDKDRSIDFYEFIVGLWNLCTLEWENMVRFAFELFDLDFSGCLDVKEIEKLTKYVCGGKKNVDKRVSKVIKMMDDDKDGEVSLAEFVKYNRKFPVLLFPAFNMQQKMRKAFFGEKFWETQSLNVRKIKISTGRSVSSVVKDLEDKEEIRAAMSDRILKEKYKTTRVTTKTKTRAMHEEKKKEMDSARALKGASESEREREEKERKRKKREKREKRATSTSKENKENDESKGDKKKERNSKGKDNDKGIKVRKMMVDWPGLAWPGQDGRKEGMKNEYPTLILSFLIAPSSVRSTQVLATFRILISNSRKRLRPLILTRKYGMFSTKWP